MALTYNIIKYKIYAMSFINIELLKKDVLYQTSEHSHDYYELFFLLEGSRDYFITNKAYSISPGMFVLLKPHMYHSTQGKVFKRLIIYFDDEFISQYLNKEITEEFFKYTIRDSYENPKILSLINSIIEENENTDSRYRENYIALKLTEIFIIMLRRQKQPQNRRYNYKNKLINDVMNYITHKYNENLSLEFLAKKFFISAYYLSHLFKKVTNFNLSEYILNVRLGETLKMLNTKLSLTEIAERTGFNSANYMSSQFKKKLGLSPQKYRKNLKYKG